MPAPDTATANELMAQFARRTGLDGSGAPVRYLWTDAFALCTFQGLVDAGAGRPFEQFAHRTIAQVHAVLGHFRADDFRSGWLAGAHGRAGETHPTRAGLRIGKPLPERGAGERFDERLEWERDGQYFHYLTRWMQALDRMARRHGQSDPNRWACELAVTAHRAFTHEPADGRRRIYWKMSTDLSRPLVASMGRHDPLDGLITALTLQATASAFHTERAARLDAAIADYAAMVDGSPLATDDPLELGSLLDGALRLAQVVRAGAADFRPLLDAMLEAAAASMPRCRLRLEAPADLRLGFRELGLAIGLAAIGRLAAEVRTGPPGVGRRTQQLVDSLHARLPLREAINRFWLQPANRAVVSWTDHRDINEVMLAASLAPAGCLAGTA